MSKAAMREEQIRLNNTTLCNKRRLASVYWPAITELIKNACMHHRKAKADHENEHYIFVMWSKL